MSVEFRRISIASSLSFAALLLVGCGGSSSSPPPASTLVTPVLHPVQANDQWTFNSQATKTVGGVTTPIGITQTVTAGTVTPGATSSTVTETQTLQVTAGGKTTSNVATLVFLQDNATGNLVQVSSMSNGVTTTFTRNPATLGIPGTFTAGNVQTGTVTANDGTGTYTITETFTVVGQSSTLVTAGDRQWQAWNTTLDWSSTAKTGLVQKHASILYVPGLGQAVSSTEDDTFADGSTQHLVTSYNTTTVAH